MTPIRSPHPALAVALAVTFVAFGAACERQTTTTSTGPKTTTTTTVTPAPRVETAIDKAGDAVGDAAVTTRVKSALLADPEVKGLKIDVDTKNGVVSLSGTLDKGANVERAVTIAKGIEGVKSVNNQLTVKPS